MTKVTQNAGRTAPVARERSRPLGVVLLVLFQVLNVAVTVAALAGYLGPRGGSLVAMFGTGTAVVDYLILGLGVLSLAGAIALWRLDRFGWYAIMLLTGLGLAVQLTFYVWANPNFLNMAIYVVSAFYLNQREVKDIFLAKTADPEPVVLTGDQDGLG